MDERQRMMNGIVRDLQGLDFPDQRIVELRSEVERLNESVRRTAGRLTLDDEPAAFAAVLERRAPR
jgi:hypothetical protein